jgi:uncharacterized membrane protein
MKAKRKQGHRLLRLLRIHWRLLLCIAIGIAVYWLVPAASGIPARLVLGWDVGAAVYLVFAFTTIAHFDLKRARDRAADQDEGEILIPMLSAAAAMASLGAIVAVLGAIRDSASGVQAMFFALAAVTIVLSWTMVHVIFALHYAHEFYGGEDVGRGGGLKFPNEPYPDYWDFVYFSFVIGMTFQVSDVQVTKKRMRRLVVVHGIVSFFFSVGILALTVNIGSQLIS